MYARLNALKYSDDYPPDITTSSIDIFRNILKFYVKIKPENYPLMHRYFEFVFYEYSKNAEHYNVYFGKLVREYKEMKKKYFTQKTSPVFENIYKILLEPTLYNGSIVSRIVVILETQFGKDLLKNLLLMESKPSKNMRIDKFLTLHLTRDAYLWAYLSLKEVLEESIESEDFYQIDIDKLEKFLVKYSKINKSFKVTISMDDSKDRKIFEQYNVNINKIFKS
jgi:hypothetical protein